MGVKLKSNTMKKNIFFTILMIVVITTNLNAQAPATATTAASADLLIAMVLTEDSALNFGTSILTDALGGTIELPSNNTTRVYGGSGGVVGSPVAPLPTNAAYSVTGSPSETYALVLPTTTAVNNAAGSTDSFTMDLTLLKARFLNAGSDDITSTLSTTGADSFTIGGTLTVKAGQAAGQYTGSFLVSIDYN